MNSSGVYPVIAINSFGLLAVSSKLIIISSSCILACLYKKKTLKYQQNQNTASLKIDIMSNGEYHDYPGSWETTEAISASLNNIASNPIVYPMDMESVKLYDQRIEDLPSGLSDNDPTATNVKNEINAGVGFTVFSGHGARTLWAWALNTGDVAQLNNTGKLPIVFAAACDTARFHFDDSFLDIQGNTFDRSLE
ncbi:MAG: C25 family cysteine peptidase, partial [Candidatus Electrothrix sp.]